MSAGFKVWNVLHNDFLTHNPHIAGAIITSGIFIAGSVLPNVPSPARMKCTSLERFKVMMWKLIA